MSKISFPFQNSSNASAQFQQDLLFYWGYLTQPTWTLQYFANSHELNFEFQVPTSGNNLGIITAIKVNGSYPQEQLGDVLACCKILHNQNIFALEHFEMPPALQAFAFLTRELYLKSQTLKIAQEKIAQEKIFCPCSGLKASTVLNQKNKLQDEFQAKVKVRAESFLKQNTKAMTGCGSCKKEVDQIIHLKQKFSYLDEISLTKVMHHELSLKKDLVCRCHKVMLSEILYQLELNATNDNLQNFAFMFLQEKFLVGLECQKCWPAITELAHLLPHPNE